MKKRILLLTGLFIFGCSLKVVTPTSEVSNSFDVSTSVESTFSSNTSTSVSSTTSIVSSSSSSNVVTSSTSSSTSSNNSSISSSSSSAETISLVTIKEIYQIASSMELDDNGTTKQGVEKPLVKFSARYVTKYEGKNAIFFDGENPVYVYSANDDKINNGLLVNSTYEVVGRVAVYKYKPQVEYIQPFTRLFNNADPLDLTQKAEEITFGQLIAVKTTTSHLYSKVFTINSYLSDDPDNRAKLIYTLAKEPVAGYTHMPRVYIANYDDLAVDKALYDYYINGKMVRFTFIMNHWKNSNTKPYWIIFVLKDTITNPI